MTSLALHGGKPVRDTYLPYAHQKIEEEDIAAVVSVLRSDWLTTGPMVDQFENNFAQRVGSRYAIAVSSGTAALHAAIFAAGLQAGEEGITSPLTFAGTANCLLYQGAIPRFADVRNDTLNIDPSEIERHITPKTKAILPVDYSGQPADLDAIIDIARRHDLVVIEDGCHALGARYKNKNVGSISDMTVFSFHPVKHLTTGEGGMITTNNETFYERLRMFRNHGFKTDWRQRKKEESWFYEMIALGYNYRLTDIGCALGISQLARLESNLIRRKEIARIYSNELSSTGIILPFIESFAEPAWHLYPIRLDQNKIRATRAEFFRAMRAENIGVNVHYIPVICCPLSFSAS